MTNLPEYSKNFTNFKVHTVICKTKHFEESIILETRTSVKEETLLYTLVHDNVIRVNSIHDLVLSIPELIHLRLEHAVKLLWDGSFRQAELVETFIPNNESETGLFSSISLAMNLDDSTYETAKCDSLTEAYIELHEIIGKEIKWCLCSCFDCVFSGYARYYSVSDREFWCYRDSPEAFNEIQEKSKYASQEARFSGKYPVDAFHTCAAWQPQM